MSAQAVASRWRKGSHLKGALLSLLLQLDTPVHPWRLATLLNSRLGPASTIEQQSVYSLLQGLERFGLVYSQERANPNPVGNWQRQRVYSSTPAAEGAVAEWMAAAGSGVELQLKIACSQPSDAPALLRALDLYERECMKRLEACEAAREQGSSWIAMAINVSCVTDEKRLQAELDWIMVARDWIGEQAAKHEAPPR